MVDAVNARDYARVLEFHSDDVVLELHGDAARLAGDGAVGKEAFARWFADWFSMFEPDYRFEVGEVREEGDRVHIELIHHACGRRSGADVTMISKWLYELRDGKIVRCTTASG